jgi:hypothetical protein
MMSDEMRGGPASILTAPRVHSTRRALLFGAMSELVRTEHDHRDLTANVSALRGFVVALGSGDPTEDDHEAFTNQVESLLDSLIVHFDREEQGLFPFLARELPETVPALEGLESAHHAVCDPLRRIANLARDGADRFAAQWPSIAALFREFDTVYAAHARDEASFLLEFGALLDPAQRIALAELLQGI